MLALLLACAAPPPAYTPDLSAFGAAEAECIQGSCSDAKSAAELDSCRAQRCPATPESWSVEPTLLRYDGDVVTMSVQVEHAPGAFGDSLAPADGETWLGATVLKTNGEEIDMAVHTVFPGQIDEPFTFSSQVGPDVEVVIVGLWGKKIEPCDSARSGCKMFGFVLDESLAAWPEETYVATPPRRQRFLPEQVKVDVAAPPALPSAELDKLVAAVESFTTQEGPRFGATFAVARTTYETRGAGTASTNGSAGDAPAAPAASQVLHRHVHDGPLASRLAAALSSATGEEIAVRHAPDGGSDLTVVFGADVCPEGVACR